MKRLYTLVVVLFLVIIFMTMQRTSLVERFTYSKNKDIYDTDLTNINDPYPIRYRTMNAQQMIYWELIKLFQKLSNVKLIGILVILAAVFVRRRRLGFVALMCCFLILENP